MSFQTPHFAFAKVLGNNVRSRLGWWRLGEDGSRDQRVQTADNLAVAQAPWASSSDARELGGQEESNINDQHK